MPFVVLFWKSVWQRKLACRTVATESNSLNLFLVGGPVRYGNLHKCLQTRCSFLLGVPTVLRPFRMLLLARSLSTSVGGVKVKFFFHFSKVGWFSGSFFLDIFVEFLLLRKGDTGMRDLAKSLNNCAIGNGQSFKDFHEGCGER